MCRFSVIGIFQLSFQLLASRGLLQVLNSDDLLGLDGVCPLLPALIQHVVPCWLGSTINGAQGVSLLVKWSVFCSFNINNSS